MLPLERSAHRLVVGLRPRQLPLSSLLEGHLSLDVTAPWGISSWKSKWRRPPLKAPPSHWYADDCLCRARSLRGRLHARPLRVNLSRPVWRVPRTGRYRAFPRKSVVFWLESWLKPGVSGRQGRSTGFKRARRGVWSPDRRRSSSLSSDLKQIGTSNAGSGEREAPPRGNGLVQINTGLQDSLAPAEGRDTTGRSASSALPRRAQWVRPLGEEKSHESSDRMFAD